MTYFVIFSVGEKIKKQLVDTIQKELKSSKALAESSASSRAMTPAFQVHERQALISQLLAASQYNTAFQEVIRVKTQVAARRLFCNELK